MLPERLDPRLRQPASGGSITYTLNCAILPSATGTLVNNVVAVGAALDPVPGNNNATDTDTLTPQANLGITKTDGVTSATAGTTTTYTIVASNAGPSAASGSTVADTFPANCVAPTWTCVGAGGGACTAAGSAISPTRSISRSAAASATPHSVRSTRRLLAA